MKIDSVGRFSGLRNKVSNTGGFNRIWLFVLKQLNITPDPTSPRWRPKVVVGRFVTGGGACYCDGNIADVTKIADNLQKRVGSTSTMVEKWVALAVN